MFAERKKSHTFHTVLLNNGNSMEIIKASNVSLVGYIDESLYRVQIDSINFARIKFSAPCPFYLLL